MPTSITISGDKQLSKFLQEFGASIKSWRPELQGTSEFLMDLYRNGVFETQGEILGEAWKPLSASYELIKRTKFPGRGILQASGSMRGGFKPDITAVDLTITNGVPYFVFNQLGTSRMPARVMLDLPDKVVTKVVEIFTDGVQQRINK